MNAFNNFSIRNKILLVTALVLASMCTVAVFALISVQDTQAREAEVRRTYGILDESALLLAQIVNIETGTRGFVITGNESFLEPYNNGRTAFAEHLDTARKAVQDQRSQYILNEIAIAQSEWDQQVLQPQIQLRRATTQGTATLDVIAERIASGEGKRRVDGMRALFAEFEQIERDLLAQRQIESEQAATTLQLVLIGGTLAAILFSIAASVWVANGLAHRVGLVSRAADGIAAGRINEKYDLPSGNDEVGHMAQSFNTMAATIRRQIEEQQQANEQLRAAAATQVAKDYLEQVVRSYSNFANEVSRGNLSARLENITGNDELAALGRSLNTMVEGLHTITRQTREASANIAAAAAEILAATTQQAASAAEQSAAITQTTTTIEEVKAIALQTAQQAAQVAQDSQNALNAARQGTLSVEETVAGMGQIRTRVEMIAQNILGLAEQTQAIGAITATVSEISDQSNLLALNAAIEAARAGEQGKSFAVVAQHVRELAERSKAATVQVREILSEIQKATNAAVLVTEEGTKGVESGAKLAGQAGQAIHRIATEVEGGAQANVQMAAAAQQQTAGMEQIGQAMGSIQQATTQTLASTRQAEGAAQDLHTLAQNLQKTIEAYRL
ncbi:MAG: methyl-accepting chemotaxis protein [Oscillochloridaceae bacterium umkhey_bin13]